MLFGFVERFVAGDDSTWVPPHLKSLKILGEVQVTEFASSTTSMASKTDFIARIKPF